MKGQDIKTFLRKKRFPTVWCPGCGLGTVMGALVRAISSIGAGKDKVAVVSGIGCSGRMPTYLDFNTLHTTHGRALAFATGLKLARPDLLVIVILGDGDGVAIGGNHFIHSCRRNIDIKTLMINNGIYGMTGGQYSPTSPLGIASTTSRSGNTERPFNVCNLAMAAGAGFVARGTTYDAVRLQGYIKRALLKKGFSFVEVISQCPTYFGKLNRLGNAVGMLRLQARLSVDVKNWGSIPEEEREDKFMVGILRDMELPVYTAQGTAG